MDWTPKFSVLTDFFFLLIFPKASKISRIFDQNKKIVAEYF